MLYFAAGFIFIRIFNFVNVIKNQTDYENVIIKSIIVGFIANCVATAIPLSTGIVEIDVIIFLFAVILSAFGLAKLYGCRFIHKILKKLGVDRTFHSNIWDDILLDGTAWIDVRNKGTKKHYFGLISLMEDFGNKVLIKRYTVYDENDKVVEDYDNDPKEVMLIDTSKFDVIRITYPDAHQRVKDEYALDSQHYISNRDRQD